MSNDTPAPLPSAETPLTPPPPAKESESGCLYLLSAPSIIPAVGIPFACFAFIAGIFTWKKGGWKMTAIGTLGLVINVAIYGSLFYFGFMQRGGVYDGLRARMAEQQLASLVKTIELHKLQHGSYPAKLEDLSIPKSDPTSIYDTTDVGIGIGGPRKFYYQLDPAGASYYLFSVGPDGAPFTADDILPDMTSTGGLGYRVRPLAAPTSAP